MTITTQIKLSLLAFLAAVAPSQAFGQDSGKAALNAVAVDNSRLPVPSQSSTGTIVGDVLNSICRTKDVTRISEADTLALGGRLSEGQVKLQAAPKAAEEQDPANVVTRACLISNIGFLELQQRRPGAAIEWFRRGLEFNALPAAFTARLTHNLASAYLALRQLERAEEIARHLSEKTWGFRSYGVSVAAGNLATIYLLRERFTQAQPLFEQSLDSLRHKPMRAANEIPQAEAGLALSYAAGGRAQEAGMLLERAIAVLEADYGPGSQPVLDGLERYAGFLRAAKDKAGAKHMEARRKIF